MSNLAVVYERQDRFQESELLAKEALELRRRNLGDDHPHTLYSKNNLATLYAAQGRSAESEALARETYEARFRKLGEQHSETQVTLRLLCTALIENERFAEARPLCEAAVQWVEEHQPKSWSLPHAKTLLGMALIGVGKSAEGERQLLDGYDALTVHSIKRPGNRPVARAKLSAVRHLVDLYESQNEREKLDRWRKELMALTGVNG